MQLMLSITFKKGEHTYNLQLINIASASVHIASVSNGSGRTSAKHGRVLHAKRFV